MDPRPPSSPMSIRRNLDDELRTLQSFMFRMADLVEAQLADAVDALFRHDLDAAAEVVLRDDEIDRLEMEIDRHCERTLALYHPVADELRIIIAAVKINTDLERIGDHCKNMAKNIHRIQDSPAALEATNLSEMVDAARAMFRSVYKAYLNKDRHAAEAVIADDDQVDTLHRSNLQTLVAHARAHPEDMEVVARLLMMSKGIERISDHVSNIAESVVFLIEGIDVRHQRLSGQSQ